MPITTKYYSGKPDKQELECVIFVEGPDDAYFVSSLLEDLNADPTKVGITSVEGKANFQSAIGFMVKGSAYKRGAVKSFVIICDADENPNKTAESINLALSEHKQPQLRPGEVTANKTGVNLGLYILPDGVSPGDLETLCLNSIPDNPLAVKADEYITEAELIHAPNKLTGSRSKRTTQVLLASYPSGPFRGAGLGFKHGAFDKKHQNIERVANFLRLALDLNI